MEKAKRISRIGLGEQSGGNANMRNSWPAQQGTLEQTSCIGGLLHWTEIS